MQMAPAEHSSAPPPPADAGKRTAGDRSRGTYRKIVNLIAADLYADFVPRWFKPEVAEAPTGPTAQDDVVRLVSTIAKLPASTLLVLAAHSYPAYEVPLALLAAYFALDFVYQTLDIARAAGRGTLRRSATLLVDLASLPLRGLLPQRPPPADPCRTGPRGKEASSR